MSPWIRITSLAAATVVVFDIAASLASRASGVPYQWAVIGSICLYAGTGFLIARAGASGSVLAAALAGVVLGITDATLGWGASWLIGPGRTGTNLTASTWATTLLSVVALAAVVASVGGALGTRTNP